MAPENLTTLAHFSVSSAISLLKSAGEPASTVPPRSASFALNLASVRLASYNHRMGPKYSPPPRWSETASPEIGGAKESQTPRAIAPARDQGTDAACAVKDHGRLKGAQP